MVCWTKMRCSSKIPRRRFFLICNWRIDLANIKSQIKRNKQNEKRRIRNRHYRGSARTFIKKALASMESGDLENAQVETKQAIKALDRAAEKGVIHKNNAARRKSRLMKRLNSLSNQTPE